MKALEECCPRGTGTHLKIWWSRVVQVQKELLLIPDMTVSDTYGRYCRDEESCKRTFKNYKVGRRLLGPIDRYIVVMTNFTRINQKWASSNFQN